MTKMIRLTKLSRFFKFVNNRKTYMSQISMVVNRAGYDRLLFMGMSLVILSHLIACMWIYLPSIFDSDFEDGQIGYRPLWLRDHCG